MVEDSFEGFEGIIPEQRYRNAMMYHARKQTELLEQIAQLLQGTNVEEKSIVDETPNTDKEVGKDANSTVRQRGGRSVGGK